MNAETKTVRFEVRMTPAEAVRLEAIAKRANCAKGDVLRLALDPDFAAGRDPLAARKLDEIEAAISVQAASAEAIAERLAGLEKLVGDLADLTLAVSRNIAEIHSAQHARAPGAPQHRQAAPQPAKPAEPPKPNRPSWKAFQAAHPKEYPMMTAVAWDELLAEDYEKKFGVKPDLNS